MVKGLVLEAKRTPFEKQDVKCQMLSVDFWEMIGVKCQVLSPQHHNNETEAFQLPVARRDSLSQPQLHKRLPTRDEIYSRCAGFQEVGAQSHFAPDHIQLSSARAP